MNWMFWPTALVAGLLFWLGLRVEHSTASRTARWLLCATSVLAAVPGLLFALHYTKLLGEPIWFYEFRAARGSELTAAGIGLLAGWAQGLRPKQPLLQRQFKRLTIPALLAIVVAVPYVKPVLLPLNQSQLQSRWDNDVCLQSTSSSCGPASAATLARLAGKPVAESELARESLTYAGGTENWYLARALRHRGLTVIFVKAPRDVTSLPAPAIAGVKLTHGAGHFIAILGKEGDDYIVGDPLVGREVISVDALRSAYRFTGFFLVVK